MVDLAVTEGGEARAAIARQRPLVWRAFALRMHAPADQLLDGVAKDARPGRVEKGDTAIEVKPTEALTHRIEEQFNVAALRANLGGALCDEFFQPRGKTPDFFFRALAFGDVLHRARHVAGALACAQFAATFEPAHRAIRPAHPELKITRLVACDTRRKPALHQRLILGIYQTEQRLARWRVRLRGHPVDAIGLVGPVVRAGHIHGPPTNMGDALGFG